MFMKKREGKIYFFCIIILFFSNLYPTIKLQANTHEESSLISCESEISSVETEISVFYVEEETSTIKETQTTIKDTPTTQKIAQHSKNSTDLGKFKSYTDYKCLSKNSPQWKLQEQAYTDKNGLRKIDEYYLVALGSYYGTELGTKYLVTLSTGNQFKIILCDCKSDRHTDEKNQTCRQNGSVLEFYVETSKLPKEVRSAGTIGAIPSFEGSVISIEKIS